MLRQIFLGSFVLGTQFLTHSALAAPAVLSLQGSDTLAGYMSDMIIASGQEKNIVYQGGGSGLGEAALLAQTQRVTAMSRAFKSEMLIKAADLGLEIEEHVIGLDGVALFVKSDNKATSLTLDQVNKIFSCQITNWKDLGGQDLAIAVYRRNDASGTTDTFKTLAGIKTFGACVKALAETSDIAAITASQAAAIGYSGLSAGRAGNKALALAKDTSAKAYLPSPANIRSFSYPMSRKLYVYATGVLTDAEQIMFDNIIDRSFSDPILVDNEFLTLD